MASFSTASFLWRHIFLIAGMDRTAALETMCNWLLKNSIVWQSQSSSPLHLLKYLATTRQLLIVTRLIFQVFWNTRQTISLDALDAFTHWMHYSIEQCFPNTNIYIHCWPSTFRALAPFKKPPKRFASEQCNFNNICVRCAPRNDLAQTVDQVWPEHSWASERIPSTSSRVDYPIECRWRTSRVVGLT